MRKSNWIATSASRTAAAWEWFPLVSINFCKEDSAKLSKQTKWQRQHPRRESSAADAFPHFIMTCARQDSLYNNHVKTLFNGPYVTTLHMAMSMIHPAGFEADISAKSPGKNAMTGQLSAMKESSDERIVADACELGGTKL